MANLTRKSDRRAFVVSARAIIGRGANAAIQIEDPYASSEHAKLTWTRHGWEIRDLGSRNGTFIDGRRLEPGVPEFVEAGAQLGFGEPNAAWELEDASPPTASATNLRTGQTVHTDSDLLALPSDSSVRVSVYPADNGMGWLAESADGDLSEVEDGQTLNIDGVDFRLDLPVVSDATPLMQVSMSLDSIGLRFSVSRNEERVEISVLLHGREEVRLKPREHGYLLLTLARARLEDADQPAQDRGWRRVEELSRMLKLDENAINVATHRARQQLAKAGVEGAVGIVKAERGRRRLGLERFDITALD